MTPVPAGQTRVGSGGRDSSPMFVSFPGALGVRGALAVTAFPTAGLAGTIACRYLVQALEMKPLGFLDDVDMEPAVCVEAGRGYPCLRVFAAHAACGVDGRCDQLVVMYSDLSPPTERLRPLARALLHWASSRKVHSLIALEGYPSPRDGGAVGEISAPPKVVSLANSEGDSLLNGLKADRMEGLATGFTAALLLESLRSPFPLAGLVVESHKDHPDAHAAAALVDSLSRLLPRLNLDPKPLRAEADRLEEAVRRTRVSAVRYRSAVSPTESELGMYR